MINPGSISEVTIEALQEAMWGLHSCASIWVEAVPVKEVFEGKTVLDSIVQVFDLKGHPFVAVSHQGPVNAPEKAVRATIAREYPQSSDARE